MKAGKLTWHKLLRGADLTHAEFRVLTMLGTYANEHGNHAHPGKTRLAADCQMSESATKRALRALVGKGAITVTTPGGNAVRKGHATVYAVDLTAANVHGGQEGPSTVDKTRPIGVTRDTAVTGRGSWVTPKGVMGDPPSGLIHQVLEPSVENSVLGPAPLPNDWEPNDSHVRMAAQYDLDLDDAVDEFMSTWSVHNERRTDWDKAFGRFLSDVHNGSTRDWGVA